MPTPESLVVDQAPRLNYERLCVAVQEAIQGKTSTNTQFEALAELQTNREQIAFPLNPKSYRTPNSQDRNKISGLGEVTLAYKPENLQSSDDQSSEVVRLGADLVSVAIALSDELHINELDAAVLLLDARNRAAHRPDRDVVAAAKEIYALRRRESALYVQEVIRAGLLSIQNDQQSEDSFLSFLMKERDILFTQNNMVSNLTTRLQDGFNAKRKQIQGVRDIAAFQHGEALLIAECLFLLAYTVQFSSTEALSIYSLLKDASESYEKLYQHEKASLKSNRSVGVPSSFDQGSNSTQDIDPVTTEKMSPELVEAESVRNLLFLAWTSAIDRSRYHDVFDPRTGQSGVNQLLKDLLFIPRTRNLPKLEEGEEDNVRYMLKSMAAAELCGAVFRLAIAEPDEKDATETFLRVSAYGGALSFLGKDLPSWIEKRAGSLSPDTDLYADVLEDLALDVAEAPNLVHDMIQFAQGEIRAAASEVAYASLDLVGPTTPRPISTFSSRVKTEQNEFRRGSIQRNSALPPASSPKRPSTAGRPPRPPTGRNSQRSQFPLENRRRSSLDPETNVLALVPPQSQKPEPRLYSVTTSENVLALLAHFVAKAISLAPAKLMNDSSGGGIRYWAGVGGTQTGFIPKVGDAVLDFWDACNRDAHAEGGVGDTFRGALDGFLALLASSSLKAGSPAHAATALKYLHQGGHSVANLHITSESIAQIHSVLSSRTTSENADLDDADSDALRGVANVLANAAETVKDSGGIMPILEESGKELAMRMASLARHFLEPALKESLIRAIRAMENRRAIRLFLESVGSDKSAHLCRYIRGVESQQGEYNVTIAVLELATYATSWGNDDFPESAVESIANAFAVDEVLTFWGRRIYKSEAQRWRLVREATALVNGVIYRQPNHQRSFKLLAKLLSPAPGTGVASYALRSLVSTAGLMRVSEDDEQNQDDRNMMLTTEKSSKDLYRISGRDSLMHAAERGLGEAYREMQTAAKNAARMVSLMLSVPSGKLSGPGIVAAPASDLLLGEVVSLNAAASLVFTVDAYLPSLLRAGYNSSVPAAILDMLARAAHESSRIAAVLGMDSPGMTGAAAQFRSSLSDIISRSTSSESLSKNQSDMKDQQTDKYQDPSLMHSALRIVEASLGPDGGGAPGRFLLGLVFDATGHYVSSDYGVLGALVEVIAGANDTGGRLDNRNRATAATFVERLAAHTIRSTSQGVLEYIKDVGAADIEVRGGGFADEMLFRIMEELKSEPNKVSLEVDWLSLAELLAACLGLSALQVRIFPEYEQDRCNSTQVTQSAGGDISNVARFLLPSPMDLLHVISIIANGGESNVSFEAFRGWYHLLGTRLRIHENNIGYANISMLYEIASVLLESLSSAGNQPGFSSLIMKDGGETAGAAILLCLTKIRDCDSSEDPDSEQYLGSVQCGSLLGDILRAIAGITEANTNTSRARTSLYVSLFLCSKLAEKRVSTEVMGRAFGMKLGARRISGTEALVVSACTDAVSAPSAAAKSAAMAAASLATRMDPMRAIPALGAQNRLRRVSQEALSNPDSQRLIAQACSRAPTTDDQSLEPTTERAAIAVAEAAIALVHSVASSGHGARVLVDSGCVEGAVSLLTVIDSNRSGAFRDELVLARRQQSLGTKNNQNKGDVFDTNQSNRSRGSGKWGVSGDDQVSSAGAQRASIVSMLTGVIATSVGSTASLRGDGALYALEEGKELFSGILRNLFLPGVRDLETISSLSVIVSRVPPELLASAASASELRSMLASTIDTVLPRISAEYSVGMTGSLLSAGTGLRAPESIREARRMRISHPEGGSLYERDIIQARAKCLQNLFAALRQPSGLLYIFNPYFTEGGRVSELVGNTRTKNARQALSSLSEVLFVCRTMLQEIQRSIDESMQMDAKLEAAGTSISAQRQRDVAAFCQEEFRTDIESLSGNVVAECLKKTSIESRNHAHTCISVFESAIFILREYVRAARETARNYPSFYVPPNEQNERFNNQNSSVMSEKEAENLLKSAKNFVVPICKDVEGLRESIWGGYDVSFSKQVCRQIRTACAGGRN